MVGNYATYESMIDGFGSIKELNTLRKTVRSLEARCCRVAGAHREGKDVLQTFSR